MINVAEIEELMRAFYHFGIINNTETSLLYICNIVVVGGASSNYQDKSRLSD